MRTYGQYCPIARAAEIFAERWTPIILRNLMVGCATFTEISAGAPGLSRSVLTQRLRQLEQAGVIETRPKAHGRGVLYQLTDSGRALWTVLAALRDWGERWLEVSDEHTNPRVVLWAWSTIYLARERLPEHRVVVRFEFADQPQQRRRIWLLVDQAAAEVCLQHPGFDEDLIVETDARTLVRWHMKDIEWSDGLRSGSIRIHGSPALARAVPTWNRRGLPSPQASVVVAP